MKLSDVATIKTNYPEADFWIIRRGSLNTVGKPSYDFYSESIGIKVLRTDIVLPRFLYYCFLNIHNQGRWKDLAKGSLSLVNIRVSDVSSIKLTPR
jgi:hypothetical protein